MKDYLITAKQAQKERINLPDGYDSLKINYSQLCQLIDEHSPQTDFLMLKNLINWEWLENLEKKGYYVNFFDEPTTQKCFTLISWNEDLMRQKPTSRCCRTFKKIE